MIEGKYIKDGEITEVFLPNGLTQLIVEPQREIQAFTFMPRKTTKKKGQKYWVKDFLILISLVFPLIPTTMLALGAGSVRMLLILLAIGGGWDALIVHANNPLRSN